LEVHVLIPVIIKFVNGQNLREMSPTNNEIYQDTHKTMRRSATLKEHEIRPIKDNRDDLLRDSVHCAPGEHRSSGVLGCMGDGAGERAEDLPIDDQPTESQKRKTTYS
jgi:hypothetical protein